MNDSNAAQLSHMIRGYWVSQIVGTLAQLEIPDCLSETPLDYRALAKAVRCGPSATHRLLRAAAVVGLVSTSGDGRFALTPTGELLKSNVPGSMRDPAIAFTAPGHWLPWGRLVDAIRCGERQTVAVLGQELFDYYETHPCEGGAFTSAMASQSTLIANEVANLLDLSEVEHLVDIGGASGTIVSALLEKNKGLRGTILERPDVVPVARVALARRGLSARCSVVGGNFFESVPDADVHILKHILHDWNDEQGVRILHNCARALQRKGRVIVIERIIPEDGQRSSAALADLNMLVLLPGRERTGRQFAELLRSAGLYLDRVTQIAGSTHVMEASAAS